MQDIQSKGRKFRIGGQPRVPGKSRRQPNIFVDGSVNSTVTLFPVHMFVNTSGASLPEITEPLMLVAYAVCESC